MERQAGVTEVDQVDIRSRFMRTLISKLLKKALKKYLVDEVSSIILDDLQLTHHPSGITTANITISASISDDDLHNLIETLL